MEDYRRWATNEHELARKHVMGILEKMDEKALNAPDAEMERAIEEAMQFVRSRACE